MTGFPRVIALSILWIALGCWIGSMAMFGMVVAPAAFQELPADFAGRVVSRCLAAIHLYGIAAGLVVAALTLLLRRGRMLAALPVALAAACLYSHFGITAEIETLRDAAFGAEADPGARARFAQLHSRSVSVYGAVALGALALVPLHVRLERGERPRG